MTNKTTDAINSFSIFSHKAGIMSQVISSIADSLIKWVKSFPHVVTWSEGPVFDSFLGKCLDEYTACDIAVLKNQRALIYLFVE